MIKKLNFYVVLLMGLFTLCLQGRKFQEEVIHNIVKKSTKLQEKERLSFILKELNETYGTTLTPKFHLFNGGNAFGLIGILHASLTEYLIVYGSAIANGGHSGRYLLNVYDFIYRGKVVNVSPDNPEGIETHVGESTFLPWGQSTHYSLDKNTWMIEYAYGIIPSALFFPLLGLTSTGDIIGVSSLCYNYSKEAIKNII